jgi:hypothetical protein
VIAREIAGIASVRLSGRYADLAPISEEPRNDIVVDGRRNFYIGNIGFDVPSGGFSAGLIALVRPDCSARQVANEIAFANGIAVIPDNSTLIAAETIPLERPFPSAAACLAEYLSAPRLYLNYFPAVQAVSVLESVGALGGRGEAAHESDRPLSRRDQLPEHVLGRA